MAHYLVSRLLARSFAVAVAAAVLFCAQANMVDLFYGTDTIYDILASFFSLLTLLLYVRARTGGDTPSTRQAVAILASFAAALDSKEIAVVARARCSAMRLFSWPSPPLAWLRADGLVATLLSAAALLYAAGKIFGHDSIAQMDAYRLHPSLSLYLDNNLVYLQSFFYGLFSTRAAG